jgi:hypothetical protein
MDNALAAGHLTPEGHANLVLVRQRTAEESEDEEDDTNWVCLICGQDCRDAFGGASRACRREYNSD